MAQTPAPEKLTKITEVVYGSYVATCYQCDNTIEVSRTTDAVVHFADKSQRPLRQVLRLLAIYNGCDSDAEALARFPNVPWTSHTIESSEECLCDICFHEIMNKRSRANAEQSLPYIFYNPSKTGPIASPNLNMKLAAETFTKLKREGTVSATKSASATKAPTANKAKADAVRAKLAAILNKKG